MPESACCQCDRTSKTSHIYGYVFCDRCATKLSLHADKTILKNADKYSGEHSSYEEEVANRIEAMEKNYIKAKIKLMHILERLTELT